MKKSRRDFLKTAGAAALGAGAVLSASKRGYAQTKPAFKWKAQCLWSLTETTYKAFEDCRISPTPYSLPGEGVKKLDFRRYPAENRGPGTSQGPENTGFRLSPGMT